MKLKVLATCYYFEVLELGQTVPAGSAFIDHYHNKKLCYRLGVYFGGQAVAPHDIKIQIEKV